MEEDKLLSAFKKVEQRLEQQEVDKQKEEERKRFLELQKREEQAKFRQTVAIFTLLGFFILMLGWAIHYANQQGYIANIVTALTSGNKLSSSSASKMCLDPKHWNSEVCREYRKGEAEANWKDIRVSKGKPKAFAIHSNKD